MISGQNIQNVATADAALNVDIYRGKQKVTGPKSWAKLKKKENL
jgi:hypothetical protein